MSTKQYQKPVCSTFDVFNDAIDEYIEYQKFCDVIFWKRINYWEKNVIFGENKIKNRSFYFDKRSVNDMKEPKRVTKREETDIQLESTTATAAQFTLLFYFCFA